MEFISRLFCAFLSLFFGDLPFPLDDHILVQEPVPQNISVISQIEEPILVTPHFERWWKPTITSTPIKPKRLLFGPECDVVIPEVKAVGIQLPLNNYLSNLKVAGKSSHQASAMAVPVKRMGLRV
jgi:hypothetical protein